MKKVTLVIGCCLLVSLAVAADGRFVNYLFGKRGVKPVNNQLYTDECGQCHMAYQPGLLPVRSWERILSPQKLANHFEEELEIGEKTRNILLSYVIRDSKLYAEYRRSRKIVNSIPENETPIQISQTAYITHKHRKIPTEYIQGNSEVESLGNCEACHQDAQKGIYNDRSVVIPNVGRWDD